MPTEKKTPLKQNHTYNWKSIMLTTTVLNTKIVRLKYEGLS